MPRIPSNPHELFIDYMNNVGTELLRSFHEEFPEINLESQQIFKVVRFLMSNFLSCVHGTAMMIARHPALIVPFFEYGAKMIKDDKLNMSKINALTADAMRQIKGLKIQGKDGKEILIRTVYLSTVSDMDGVEAFMEAVQGDNKPAKGDTI